MNTREKLIELLDDFGVDDDFLYNFEIADHLITNGVTIIDKGDIMEHLKDYQIIPIQDEKSYDYLRGFYDGTTKWMSLYKQPKGE